MTAVEQTDGLAPEAIAGQRAALLSAERRAATLADLASLMSEGRDPVTLAERAIELTVRATRATGAFVYLWDRDQERLVLRVATDGWLRAHLGRIKLRLGEGVAGWSALMRETVIIPHDPKLDPRWKVVPEMREPTIGSIVAVPIVASGDDVLGVFFVYSFRTDAFPPSAGRLAAEVGSLLASGLVQAETLTKLKMQSAAAMFLADLPDAAWGSVEQGLEVMASHCCVHFDADICVIEAIGDRLLPQRRSSVIAVGKRFEEEQRLNDGFEPLRQDGLSAVLARTNLNRLRVPMRAGGPIGVLTWYRERRFTPEDELLAEAVANQVAVGALALITGERDRPTLEQLLFAADAASVERLLRRHRWEPRSTWVAVLRVHAAVGEDAQGAEDERVRAALVDVFGDDQRSLLLRGRGGLYLAMMRNVEPGYRDQLIKRMRSLGEEGNMRMAVGVGPVVSASETHSGLAHALAAFRWAEMCDITDGALVRHEDVLHLRLLPSVELRAAPAMKPYLACFAALIKYDLDNSADLAQTLEAFIASRGSMAKTAANLFIHRNTLRQRMQRIEELIGVSPEEFEDWITAGVAARLVVSSESEAAPR